MTYSEREQERMDREDAMVANYDPADRARGVDGPEDPPEYECEVCGREVSYSGAWCLRCDRERDG